MAMNQIILNKYWDLLSNSEDFFDTGYRNDHPGAPIIKTVCPAGNGVEEAGLPRLHNEIEKCRNCRLCENRQRTVPGCGSHHPLILVLGTAPTSLDEKEQCPYSGEPGVYLDKWLSAINMDRQRDCFLTNMVKCSPGSDNPPGNREIGSCFPFLEKQIGLLKPKAILCTGPLPAQKLTGNISWELDKLRGKIFSYCNIPIVTTYHPETVLLNQSLRRAVWDDLKLLRSQTG